MSKVQMPSFGMSMTQGTISKWLKNDGETVTKGDLIVEITTEKVTNEMEAPASGVLKILAQEGEVVESGVEFAEIV